MQRRTLVFGVLAAAAAAVLVGTQLASARNAPPGRAPAAAAGACSFGNGIKHFVYLQFDNTHYRRDRPNVQSDLEQMPHLLNFLEDNGTLFTNDHTVLISHTANGILSSLTGLYPDRNGVTVGNSYGFFDSTGATHIGASAFKYWTSPVDAAFDPKPNMITDGGKNTPAPWVTFTRAGCDVGGVGVANIELENNTTTPGGDIYNVYGPTSPEAMEPPALRTTDFVGIAIHCGNAPTSKCAGNTHARPDPLPDEPGGYNNFSALFGAKYVNQAVAGGPCVNDTAGNPIKDPAGNCGFPGFDGMLANNTLGITEQMQENGVPVTFGYISDAHDCHVPNPITDAYVSTAQGPGESCSVNQLKAYDAAFDAFFKNLAAHGIDKSNTLFLVTVEEGDHFAGGIGAPQADGTLAYAHTVCNTTAACPANQIGEVNANLAPLLPGEAPFVVHSDSAPTFYVTGNPAPTDPAARRLELHTSSLLIPDPYASPSGTVWQSTPVTEALADPVEEKALHMVNADPARTPTFTLFANPDFFLTSSTTFPTPAGCATNPCVSPGFAWNHGDIQEEIANTWAGFVGPGIARNGVDEATWTDHTNLRPTFLALLGLKDDYATDGRVLVEGLTTRATPHALVAHRETVAQLGTIYEQLNAAFGQFGEDTLKASTIALKSPDTLTYDTIEAKIADLTSQRDALAAQIKSALSAAAFDGQSLDERQARDWIGQANDLLGQADALANLYSADTDQKKLNKVKHIVVIYEENHSFDNLYGGWEGVNGIGGPGYAAHSTQVDQSGVPLSCLLQLDVNLKVPPLLSICTATDKNGATSPSHFVNAPFKIDDYIKATDTTCPPPSVFAANGVPNGSGLPGGCTRDIVHRFYQEEFQLDGGKQDQYVLGSDAGGLTMGYYDTKQLPIYKYLHEKDHPDYAIEDNFFQGGFGGSFFNHQVLIAATAPPYNGTVPTSLRSVLDSRGFPNSTYPYYSTSGVTDGAVTATCASLPATVWMLGCGDFAVNTIQPSSWPYSSPTAAKLPLVTNETIGDELTAAGVDWAWYSGGWSNANGLVGAPGYTNGDGTACIDKNANPANSTPPRCPDYLFQYHHQAFNYYANYAPDTPGRAHLQDEQAFIDAATASTGGDCNLKPVSFIKPIGEENEHPGYASEPNGSDHLVELLQDIEKSACAKDTMVVVTYDEFGGQWDHVSPPGQGNNNGPHDVWGPSTRIPALVVAPHLKHGFVVDSAEHDTTSILATIEHRYGLAPLTTRDAEVPDLSTVFTAGGRDHGNGHGNGNDDDQGDDDDNQSG